MSQWSFYKPYRLQDARICCGIQFVINDEPSLERLLSSILDISNVIQRNANVGDYSLGVTAITVRKLARSELRFALLVRLAFPEECEINPIKDAMESIKKDLSVWLADHEILFRDSNDDTSVLPYYPVWYPNSSSKMYVGSFQKKSETINLSGRKALWYQPLTVEKALDIGSINNIMIEYPDSGFSFEILRTPINLISIINKFTSDDERVVSLKRAISKKAAVLARVISWGCKDYIESIDRYLEKSINAVSHASPLDNPTAFYLVYDPWAQLEASLDPNIAFNAGKYILSSDEVGLLFPKQELEGSQLQQEMSPPNSTQIAVGPSHLPNIEHHVADLKPWLDEGFKDVKDLVQAVFSEILGVQSQVNKLQEQADRNEQQFVGAFQELLCRFDKNSTEFDRFYSKMVSVSEQVAFIDSLIPEGFVVSFTKAELAWLNVESEDELSTKLKLDDYTIQLMRTSFTLARTGMTVDPTKAAIMHFSFPLGTLYEAMIRSYFKPAIFDHSPRKAELDAKQATLPQNRRNDIDLKEFDRIDDAQLDAYTKHVVINGSIHQEVYWLVWLNLFKIIRELRNKVHTNNGKVSINETTLLYQLMLNPEIAPKKQALQYAYDLIDKKRILFLKGYTIREFIAIVEQNHTWFQPSIINFILLCRDSEWKESITK